MVGIERVRGNDGAQGDVGSTLPSARRASAGRPAPETGRSPARPPADADAAGQRHAPRRRRLPTTDAVVRPMGLAVERPCSRPACSTPARATLRFSYVDREASIEPLADEPAPQTYDLCSTHAARTRPPHGWTLRDDRPEDERRPDAPPPAPADLGGDHTVAVLAAALRTAPDAVSEDATGAVTAEVGAADLTGDSQPADDDRAGATSPDTSVHRPRPPLAARPGAAGPHPAPRETA